MFSNIKRYFYLLLNTKIETINEPGNNILAYKIRRIRTIANSKLLRLVQNLKSFKKFTNDFKLYPIFLFSEILSSTILLLFSKIALQNIDEKCVFQTQ